MNIKSTAEQEFTANTMRSNYSGNNVASGNNVVDNMDYNFGFTPSIESYFSSVAKPVSFSSQNSIYLEGSTAQSIYFVTSGMVKLISYMPNGRARIVRILGKGGVLGLEGLLRDGLYKHTAVAVGGVKLYRIAVSRFRSLMQNDSDLTAKIIEHWHNHLFYADTWITKFSAGAIKSRVARLVDFLGAIEYGTESICVRLLTCEEMAEVLGVTPESVSRVLAQFKRDQLLLSIQDRPFEVFKRDKIRLQAIAGM